MGFFNWLLGLFRQTEVNEGSKELPAPESNPDWFWDLISQTLSTENDEDARCEALRRVLEPLSADELFAFDCEYRRLIYAGYRWDLWAAAYIINDGASDDSFDYFRDWLISQGREVFSAAMTDPESLVGTHFPEYAENESFRYVVQEVHEAKFGIELPDNDLKQPRDPEGEEWDESDLGTMYPKLSAWVHANR